MRIIRILWYCLVGIGLLFLTFAATSGYNTWEQRRSMGQAEGTIVAEYNEKTLSTEDIRFSTPDGKTYTFKGDRNSSQALYKGKKVKVLYELDDPNMARIDMGDPWSSSVLLLEWGAAFTLIGGIPLFFTVRKARRDEWLKLNGQLVEADFVNVQLNMSLSVNEKHPWLIKATANGQTFESDNLWTDPAPYITSKQKINVMVDPANPKRYWMDLTFLPKPD